VIDREAKEKSDEYFARKREGKIGGTTLKTRYLQSLIEK